MESANKTNSPAKKPGEKFGCLKVNGKTFGIYKGHNLIGRNLKARVTLKDLNISQIQAVITVLDNQSQFISDFGSSNGTYVGDISLKPYELHPLDDKTEINFAKSITAVYHKIPFDEIFNETNFESQHTQITDATSSILTANTQLILETTNNTSLEAKNNYEIPDDDYDFSLIATPCFESEANNVSEEKTLPHSSNKVSNAIETTQEVSNVTIHDIPTQHFEHEGDPVEITNTNINLEAAKGTSIHDLCTQVCEFNSYEVEPSPASSINFAADCHDLHGLGLEEVNDTKEESLEEKSEINDNASDSTDVDTDIEDTTNIPELVTENPESEKTTEDNSLQNKANTYKNLYRRNMILSTQSETSDPSLEARINQIRTAIDDSDTDIEEPPEGQSSTSKILYRRNLILSNSVTTVENKQGRIEKIRAVIDDSDTDVEDNPTTSKPIENISVSDVDDSIIVWKRNQNDSFDDSNLVIPSTQDPCDTSNKITDDIPGSPNFLDNNSSSEDFSLNVSQYCKDGLLDQETLNTTENKEEILNSENLDNPKDQLKNPLQQTKTLNDEDLDEIDGVFNLSTQEYMNNKTNFKDLNTREDELTPSETIFEKKLDTEKLNNPAALNNTQIGDSKSDCDGVFDLPTQKIDSQEKVKNSEDSIFLEPTQKINSLTTSSEVKMDSNFENNLDTEKLDNPATQTKIQIDDLQSDCDSVFDLPTQKIDAQEKVKDSQDSIFLEPTQKIYSHSTQTDMLSKGKNEIFVVPTQKIDSQSTKTNCKSKPDDKIFSEADNEIFAAPTQKVEEIQSNKTKLNEESESENDIFEAATQKIDVATRKNSNEEDEEEFFAACTQKINNVPTKEGSFVDDDFFAASTQKVNFNVPTNKVGESESENDIFVASTQKIGIATNIIEEHKTNGPKSDVDEEEFFAACTQKINNVPTNKVDEEFCAIKKITPENVADKEDDDFYLAPTQKFDEGDSNKLNVPERKEQIEKSQDIVIEISNQKNIDEASTDNDMFIAPTQNLPPVETNESSNDSEIFAMATQKAVIEYNSDDSNDSELFIAATQKISKNDFEDSNLCIPETQHFNDGNNDDSTNSTVFDDAHVDKIEEDVLECQKTKEIYKKEATDQESRDLTEEKAKENQSLEGLASCSNISDFSSILTKPCSTSFENIENLTGKINTDSKKGTIDEVKQSESTIVNSNIVENKGTENLESKIKTENGSLPNNTDTVNILYQKDEILFAKGEASDTTIEKKLKKMKVLVDDEEEQRLKKTQDKSPISINRLNIKKDNNEFCVDKRTEEVKCKRTMRSSKKTVESIKVKDLQEILPPKTQGKNNLLTLNVTKKENNKKSATRSSKILNLAKNKHLKDTGSDSDSEPSPEYSEIDDFASVNINLSKKPTENEENIPKFEKDKNILTTPKTEEHGVESQLEVIFKSQDTTNLADDNRPQNPIAEILISSTQDILTTLEGIKRDSKKSNITPKRLLRTNATNNNDCAKSHTPDIKEDSKTTGIDKPRRLTRKRSRDEKNIEDGNSNKLKVIKEKVSTTIEDMKLQESLVVPKILRLCEESENNNEISSSVKKPIIQETVRRTRRQNSKDEKHVRDKLQLMEEIKDEVQLEVPKKRRQIKQEPSTSVTKVIKEKISTTTEDTKLQESLVVPKKLRLSEEFENNNESSTSVKKPIIQETVRRTRRQNSKDEKHVGDKLELMEEIKDEAQLEVPKKGRQIKKEPSTSVTKGKRGRKPKATKVIPEVVEDDSGDEDIIVRVPRKQLKLEVSKINESILNTTKTNSSLNRNNESTLTSSIIGTPRRRKNNPNITELLSTPERAKRNVKHRVVFTLLKDPELEATIVGLGGSMVSSVQNCTVLVTKEILRTIKLLSAIGECKPICSPEWIQLSKKENKFLDPWEHLLNDPVAEKKWTFSLKESLSKSRSAKLFKGYSFLILINSGTAFDTMTGAIESCGGKVVSKQVKTGTFIVVSAPEFSKKHAKFLKQGIKVVAAEAVFDGVLRQKIVFDEHLL